MRIRMLNHQIESVGWPGFQLDCESLIGGKIFKSRAVLGHRL